MNSKWKGRLLFSALLVIALLGMWAGAVFTWGLILVYTCVMGIGWLVSTFVWHLEGAGSKFAGFLMAAIPVFCGASWCSFWISVAGILRR